MSDSYSKKYYNNNKDKILSLQRERRKNANFRDKMKAYYTNYYRENRNKILEQSRTRRTYGKRSDIDPTLKGVRIVKGPFLLTFS